MPGADPGEGFLNTNYQLYSTNFGCRRGQFRAGSHCGMEGAQAAARSAA